MTRTKLLFALLVLVGIATSCNKQEKQVINKGEKYVAPEYPKVFTYHENDVNQYDSAIVMASDGHEYLLYDNDGTDEKFEHYWNCKTCKETK